MVCSVLGYEASLQLGFNWLISIFLHNLAVIPDWSWEEVSVASTHSSAIVDLPSSQSFRILALTFGSLNHLWVF